MKTSRAVRLYIAHKRSMGWQFTSIEQFLFAFSEHVTDIHLSCISESQVSEFLGPPTTSAYQRYERLRRFFKHWQVRGELHFLPLPAPIPRGHSTFVPYIYSRHEIRRLVSDAALNGTKKPRVIDPMTMRTLLLFLYGTGVSVSEALTLRECDVDLRLDVITVRRNAHARKRTIPVGPDVHSLLSTYLESPIRKNFSGENLFLTRKGTPVFLPTLNAVFRVLRRNANVVRLDGGRFQPRLNDFRSTFAVHRITAWYEQGLDAQELLPALGAYLGQLGLVSMNRHLSLTPAHYRKHLTNGSRLQASRKRVDEDSPLVAEFLRRIEGARPL